VTFNFNLLPDVAIGDATRYIEDAFAQIHPRYPTVQATFQGEALVFRQLFRSLPILLLAAIFVMYVILGILYESYVHPFTVLFPAIVPAVVGGQDAASRRPLGLVIVGGLIFSQLVTLFITPVIYLWLEWFQEHVLDKVPFLRSAHYHDEGQPARGQMRPEPVGAP